MTERSFASSGQAFHGRVREDTAFPSRVVSKRCIERRYRDSNYQRPVGPTDSRGQFAGRANNCSTNKIQPHLCPGGGPSASGIFLIDKRDHRERRETKEITLPFDSVQPTKYPLFQEVRALDEPRGTRYR